MKKKYSLLFTLIFISIIHFSLYAKDKDFQLQIHLRVMDNNIPLENLKKNDLTVFVNEKEIKISHLESTKMGISFPTSPFRNFVLSFNLFDYGEQVSEGIDFFFGNILTDMDRILIITPVKVYTFLTNVPRDKLTNDIKDIVKKDCQNFKAERATYQNSLKETFKKGESGGWQSSTSRVGEPPTLARDQIVRFLNSFQREWLTFKNRFLIPDLNKYKAVAEYFHGNDGDTWFINFQQREIIPELDVLKKTLDGLKDFLSSLDDPLDQSWAPMISKAVNELEKSLLISDRFPQEEIQDILLFSNIPYNVILFRSKRQQEGASAHEKISPDFENILRNISKATGGFALATTDLKEGLVQLSQHTDFYYLMNIPVQTGKEIKISIEPKKEAEDIFYKKTFTTEEIMNAKKVTMDKIKITDVSVKSKQIKFSLSNYSFDDKADKSKMGVEVKIVIENEKREMIYKTSNVLTPTKNIITITLPPLERIQGKNRVFISAEDKTSRLISIFNKDFSF